MPWSLIFPHVPPQCASLPLGLPASGPRWAHYCEVMAWGPEALIGVLLIRV